MVFRSMALAISGRYHFPWVSPMYSGCMPAIKILFVFRLLIYLLCKGNLNQKPRKVEGKLVFLPYACSGILLSNRKEWTHRKTGTNLCAYCSVKESILKSLHTVWPHLWHSGKGKATWTFRSWGGGGNLCDTLGWMPVTMHLSKPIALDAPKGQL